MSFSSDTKNEILSVKNEKPCCMLAEFSAIFGFAGRVKREGDQFYLQIVTENAALARRVFRLLKALFPVTPKISAYKKKQTRHFGYVVRIEDAADVLTVLKGLGLVQHAPEEYVRFLIAPGMTDSPCCKKAFVRGAFLAGGSLIHPDKNYHLEFVTSHYGLSEAFSTLLKSLSLNPKTVVRKSNYVLYFKNSEEIADVLTIVGAVNALMAFHNVKILKEMRNNVNRLVNCETANVDKTVSAAVRQLDSIRLLKERGILETLSPGLQEIAALRLENEALSLKELGELLTPPLGKSGVNHRLNKLMDIARQIER